VAPGRILEFFVTATLKHLCILAALTAVLGGCKGRSASPAEQDDGPSRVAETTTGATPAEDRPLHDAIDAPRQAVARRLITRGLRYLIKHRDDDGGWSMGPQRQLQPALTALVVKAMVQDPHFSATSGEVDKALKVLLSYRRADGGIYSPQEPAKSYATSLAVMALAACDRDDLAVPLRDAVLFLKGLQIVPGSESPDGQTIGDDHPFAGGVSYGRHGRPDLSNVGMWMQALHDAGASGDDPAVQRALAFAARTQNRSESNTMAWAKVGGNDGGHIYAPALATDLTVGESKAGVGVGGYGLRSYGSMTYVGFKSMLYADVARDDPRVRAAFDWIRRYWRLDSNPNMPAARSREGLYYYYHVFAKALRAWGDPIITGPDGVEHNWRHELIDALAERIGDDGSWVNSESRWLEDQPILVTAYAVIALQEATRP